VRQIVANHLHADVRKIRAESTMGDLGCSKSQFLDLTRAIEHDFSTTLSSKDEPRLDGNDDSWKNIRIIDLANMVRPEWNEPLKE
jgi:hypothetical protein